MHMSSVWFVIAPATCIALGLLWICTGGERKGAGGRTKSTRIQRLHVEYIDPLHLPQNLESFKTGRLFEVGGDSPGSGAGTHEIFFRFDVCILGESGC